MCILSGGEVYSWGWYVFDKEKKKKKTREEKRKEKKKLTRVLHSGIFGRLGHASVKSEPEPHEIKALLGCPIVNIFCGATSFAVDNRGGLWSWGSAAYLSSSTANPFPLFFF